LADRVGLWTSPQLGHDLATVHLLSQEPAEAERQLGRVLQKQPEEFPAAVRLGRLALSQNRIADAQQYLRPVFAANERRFSPAEFQMRSQAFVLAGQGAERRSEMEEALRHYEAAARDNSRNGEAHLAAGTLLARCGRFAEAEPHLRLAETSHPARALVLENLAIVSLQLGRHAEAIAQLEELLRDQPRQPQTHYHLGVALYGAGRTAEAADHFRTAVELQPNHAAAQAALATLQFRSGDCSGPAPRDEPKAGRDSVHR
jgi:tetratricopeptide (TPR) repeat protein